MIYQSLRSVQLNYCGLPVVGLVPVWARPLNFASLVLQHSVSLIPEAVAAPLAEKSRS